MYMSVESLMCIHSSVRMNMTTCAFIENIGSKMQKALYLELGNRLRCKEIKVVSIIYLCRMFSSLSSHQRQLRLSEACLLLQPCAQ